MAGMLLVAWLLSALSFARAADAGASGWTGALAVAPAVQFAVIVGLCVAPPRGLGSEQTQELPVASEDRRLLASTQGLLAGAGVSVAAVALSTLLFGTYGYGLFVASPFIVGAVTAFLANRSQELSPGETSLVVLLALTLGGLAIVVVALEGIICLIMAAPLAVGMGLVGGLLGRSVARRGRPSPESSVFAIGMLPLLFAIDHAVPNQLSFTDLDSVIVAAPSPAVWRAMVGSQRIDARPALPFRLGLAYPIDGRFVGQGVGALRRGVFSTGLAAERVSVWRPGQELGFVVLVDPPMMRELSPYPALRTPHLTGYFRTVEWRFSLTALPGGRTRLSLASANTLRLDPALYWLPFARWAVDQNQLRVLTHFKRAAEAAPLP